jgi:signal transduction histidine kinase
MAKTVNAKLNLSAEAFIQIAEQALTGFIIFDLATNTCQYANQIARETLDLGENIDSLTLAKLYPEGAINNRFRAFSDEMVHFEGVFQEIMMRKISGQKIVASLGVRKLNLMTGDNQPVQCVLLMIQDMTIQVKLQREVEAKQTQINVAYQELLAQNSQLKELDAAKNRFIALITHELRTPVSGIVASSEVLKMKLYDDQKQHDEFVDMIHTEGNHLLSLVNDVLDFAKIQAGKMDFFIEQKDLMPVIEHELDVLQNMAAQDQIKMEFRGCDGSTQCYFDELRLKQVIANIVNNAIKYNVTGGSVSVWVENKGTTLELYVRDTGKGIKPEDQPKVFDEFETLGKISLHNKGTGLGMPITKRLLEGMGGTIKLTSEVGVGTTFWITLPTEKVLSADKYRSRPGSDDSGDLAA